MQGELKMLAELALFAKIVQSGGISRCADELGMERTTISRRLRWLEQKLGVKLLNRSSRRMTVTPAGLRCLEQCELLLETSKSACSLATGGVAVGATGPVVLGAPPDIIKGFLEPKVTAFESKNLGILVERRPVTAWTEEAVAAVDVGITLAPQDVAGGWTKTIARVRQSVFSSSKYSVNHPPVKSPADLVVHDSIVESSDSDVETWRFEKSKTVAIIGKHVVSSLLEAREATLAGLGISRLPLYLCESHVKSGALVELIPDVKSVPRDVIIISPRRRQPNLGTAALRIHLESAFGMETL